MTEEVTTEVTNDAATGDNINNDSLLSGASVDTTTEQTTEPAGEFDYVPSKFMNEDGSPDYEKLANSYSELEKKIGSKIGVESIEDYSYEWGSGASPEDLAEDEVYQAAVQEMYDLGLSQDQFAGVMGQYESTLMDIVEQLVTSPEAAQEQLTEAWGNDYETNLTAARTAFDSFAPEGLDINSGAFNDPAVLQLLASIGAQMGEDTRPVASNQATAGMSQTDVELIMQEEDYYTNDEKQAKVAAYFNSKNS